MVKITIEEGSEVRVIEAEGVMIMGVTKAEGGTKVSAGLIGVFTGKTVMALIDETANLIAEACKKVFE